MNNRISLVPEDRKSLGLVIMQSILKNISLPNMDRFSSFLRINKLKELQECKEYSRSLASKSPSLYALVNSLSGGNQQKVVISLPYGVGKEPSPVLSLVPWLWPVWKTE